MSFKSIITKKVLFLFSILLGLLYCQTIKQITLGSTFKGHMELDEGHEYYMLIMPESERRKVLILTIHQDPIEYLKTDEIFSDPDFYVSKKNKYPSSGLSSEWFSERYGNDILAIPSESVDGGDTFYIGVYCQFKCRYVLHVNTSNETEINLGKHYNVNAGSFESMTYKLHISEPFKELNVYAYSSQTKNFKVYMSKEGPSSQNTFNVIPSWSTGYAFSILEKTEEYCVDCDYHILIQNDGIPPLTDLILYTFIQDSRIALSHDFPSYNAINKESKRCFLFNITKSEKSKEKLIIHTTLFSGSLHLFAEGWTPKEPKDLSKNPNYYNIFMERFILFDKKDFDSFDNDDPFFQGKDSTFHFCVYTNFLETSFVLSAYYLTKMGKEQAFSETNILMPNNLLRGYLLKDQIFNYQVAGFNLDKNGFDIKTNITVKLMQMVGKTNIYGYFCRNDKCVFDKKELNKLKKEHQLVESKISDDSTTSSIINISYEDNICFKYPETKLENGNTVACSTIILIECISPSEDGLCLYDIKLEVKDYPTPMKPKQLYLGQIPLGKEDYYEIIISNDKAYSLVVVLNSEEGDAELALYKMEMGETNLDKKRYMISSSHNDYIPDIIRVKPSMLRESNINGRYIAKVTATTYARYRIYYYIVYYKNKEENDFQNRPPDVTMNLEVGQIINDYFPGDIRYKIYSFMPLMDKKENLKIFMNKINVDFTLYIYSDITKFQIRQFYEIRDSNRQNIISGYDFKSSGNNEVIINSTAPDYDMKRIYYIIVAPNLPKESQKINTSIKHRYWMYPNRFNPLTIELKSAIKYFLGVSTESSLLSINEGISHSFSLNKDYNGQKYFYTHFQNETDFELNINVLTGEINIFIDIKEIDKSSIEKLETEKQTDLIQKGTMFYKLNINKESKITIPSDFIIKNKKPNEPGICFYFYIKRSISAINEEKTCEYIFLEKSSSTKGGFLYPGTVLTSSIPYGGAHYYIIEEVEKRKKGIITITYKNGYGNIFVRIPEVPETKNIRYPDEKLFDYKGTSIYSGQLVEIPEKIFNRLNKENIKVQILITVKAPLNQKGGVNTTDNMEMSYSISYSNEPKRINQNEPYDGFIKAGELQYYSFYFDENTENIYIGLTNMNGDADMYLNYGLNLPSPASFDWNSILLRHEYIDFNLEDEYFTQRGIKSLSGYYSLLIAGFSDTSFTLFVSTHKYKVVTLKDNVPVTCKCQKSGEKCYFRYNDVFNPFNFNKSIDQNEIIFTTQYLYGSGTMYGKLYKDSELHGETIYSNLPGEGNYDLSNLLSNQRNYMKMKVSGEKFTKDSTVLLAFICFEETKVDITTTSKKYFKGVEFLIENKENMFFIGYNKDKKEQPEQTLYYYNYKKNKDFIYSIHSYIGDAHIKVYSNDSFWDIESGRQISNYKLFNEFDITSVNDDKNDNNGIFNSYIKDYHNYIPAIDKEKVENIMFDIIPKSEFGFYIQCINDKDWVNIPFGKSKSYFIDNRMLYGYFDILEEYSDVEFSLVLEKNLEFFGELYIKINIIDTSQSTDIQNNVEVKESTLYHYSIPDPNNYDYKARTDKTLGSISLDINNLPKINEEEKGYKFIRALFFFTITNKPFQSIMEINNDDTISEKKNNKKEDKTTSVTILLSAGMNNLKHIEANPFEYYFSNLNYDNSKEEKIPESKVYSLTKIQPEHDVMVIEISSCEGDYEIKIQNRLVVKTSPDLSIPFIDEKNNGKHTIYINNLNSKHFYLTITSKKNDVSCLSNENVQKYCGNDLSYVMYYYTTYKEKLKFSSINKALTYRPYGIGKIKLELPNIITYDINKKIKNIEDFKFDVFATRNKEYFNKMGSICFLSKFKTSPSTIFTIEDIKVENKNALIIEGLGYYKTYYMNILVQNTQTKELIVFDPIEITSGGILPFTLWKTLIVFAVIIILIILTIIYCVKLRNVKVELKEIKGDTLPKTESEVSGPGSYSDQREGIKYSGLGNNY